MLHCGVCYRKFIVNKVLLERRSKETEITDSDTVNMNFDGTYGLRYGPNFLEAHSRTSGFLLSRSLKMHVAGKRLTTEADVKQAVTWLQTLDCGLCYSRIQVLIPRLDNFLQFHDDNVEIRCDPSLAHEPCIHRSQDKALGISVSVNFCFETHLYFQLSTTRLIGDVCVPVFAMPYPSSDIASVRAGVSISTLKS